MSLADRARLHAVPRRGMCSTIPARAADNGLLSGDGKMYISVFGNPLSEQIYFNEEHLLTPWKGKPLVAPKIAYVLPEVRGLMLAGEYKKALDLSLNAAAKAGTAPGTNNLSDHPAFDMRIEMPHRHEVTNYLRTTDFESGEIKVTWTDNEGVWERRVFVSRPDKVVVQTLTAPPHALLTADISLDTSMILHHQTRQVSAGITVGGPYRQHAPTSSPGADEIRFTRHFDQHHLVLEGRYVVESGTPGYASVTRVVANGGAVSSDGNTLHVRGVRSLLLITRIDAYAAMEPAEVSALEHGIDQINPDYDALLARHRPQQAEVIDRTSMDFGARPLHDLSGEEMLTDQRTRQGYDGALLANLFDMGRYWLYLRSGEFPPMWGHINVNVNLQISSAPMANLPEAMNSFVHWVESLLPDARVNARNIFGARGALFGIHPTQEGDPLTHFDYTWPHHYWISGGGWLYSPIWDYYLVTGDRQFLRDHVLPGLQELALFYEDYLKDTDSHGNYIFLPSYSPENWPANSEGAPSVINADMDIAVCREVFTHLITAAQTLGVDAGNVGHWQAILAKLPPYYLDTDGALKEWAWPTLEERLDHRHVSHLYGVWPSDEITPDQTAELARAAWLAARKRAQGNASAHGIFHRSLAAARLKDAWLVNFDLKQILEQGYINPALTTMHNPYAFPSPDPQGALPTLMMEMLIYSRPGVIELLPAVPPTLTEGTVKGILCRTQAKIDNFSWNLDTKKIDLTLTSGLNQTISLRVPGAAPVDVQLSPAKPLTLHLTIGDHLPSDWILHTPANPEP